MSDFSTSDLTATPAHAPPSTLPVTQQAPRKSRWRLTGALVTGVAIVTLYPASQGVLRLLANRESPLPATRPSVIPASLPTASRLQASVSSLLPPSSEDKDTAAQPARRRGVLQTTRLERAGHSVEVVAGVALVRPIHDAQARARLQALGAQVVYVSSSGYWRVSAPEGMALQVFLTSLEQTGAFDAVQPEGVIRAASLENGQIAKRSLEWNLDQIRWNEAYNSHKVSLGQLAGVTVAVVDSGVAYETRADGPVHFTASSDLGHSVIVPGPDLVDNDGHPNDLNGHGTHLANIIAADGGTVGVAPHVRLMPIRVLDAHNAGTELALVDAVNYAVDHGADVINLSLSFPLGYMPGSALAAALQHAADSDVFVAAASGNSGEDTVSYPAAYGNVTSVGASRLTKSGLTWVADYSNIGPGLDVVAPGGVGTLDVDRNGKPDGIVAQSIDPLDPSSLHYYLMSGTSQATAHVAGAAAWLRAVGASSVEIKQALINTSSGTWGARSFARREGLGVVNLPKALNAYLADSAAVDVDERYYVDLMPLMYASGDKVGGMGLIKVVDSAGLPARKVLLAGHWFGSSASNFGVITNNNGEAFVTTSSTVPASSAVGFGLQVDRVLDGKSRVAPAPTSFYYLSEGMLGSLIAWGRDSRMAGADLLFAAEPGVHGIPTWVASSYVVKPVGPVNSLVPTALTFNRAYIGGLASKSSSSFVPVNATFPGTLPFGWGRESSLSVKVVNDVHFLNGEVRRLAIAPLDLGMYYGERATSLPVLNGSSTSFVSDTYSFLGGLNSGATGAGVLSTLVGDGVLTSLVGEGVLSSLVGEAVLSTLVGEGVLSTLVGEGVLVSLVGEGAMTTLVGDGVLSTLAGEGAMSTLTGDGLEVELLGSSAVVPVMIASSYSDSPGAEPDPLETVTFDGYEDTIVETPDE